MTSDSDYFQYLAKRSLVGYLYRKFWLYPNLNSYLHGKTLDVGCGIGDFLGLRKNVVGTDINSKTVDYCKSMGYDVHLMLPDVLPFSDDSFDSIILDNVIEHISDPSMLLVEIARVLKVGGIFVVGVPGELGFALDTDHKQYYSQESISLILTPFKFEHLKTRCMPLPLSFLGERLRSYCIYGIYKLGS